VTRPAGPGKRRVLLVPGGASTVHWYFRQLATSPGPQATVIQVDPPGIGAASDRRPLRLATHAHALSQTVRGTGHDPAVVVLGSSTVTLPASRAELQDLLAHSWWGSPTSAPVASEG